MPTPIDSPNAFRPKSLRSAWEAAMRSRPSLRPENSAVPHLTFREYVSRAMPSYRWYRHCELLESVLERVMAGEIKRLMVFEPPRHGKSLMLSRLFTGYFLYCHPDRWVALASYAAGLAMTLSRASQNHYLRPGGQIGQAQAVNHWETGFGGGMWAAGVGGQL